MRRRLPEQIFWTYRSEEQRTLSWLRVCNSINSSREFQYYKEMAEIIASKDHPQRKTCLDFITEMSKKDCLSFKQNEIEEVVRIVITQCIGRQLQNLAKSIELQALCSLLLHENICKKFYSLLLESCLEVIQDTNARLHPLMILKSFLNYAIGVRSGKKSGAQFRHQYLEQIVETTFSKISSLVNSISEGGIQKNICLNQICISLKNLACSSETVNLIERDLINLIALSQITSQTLNFYSQDVEGVEVLFQLLCLTSISLFQNKKWNYCCKQLLMDLTYVFILKCPSVIKFWEQFLDRSRDNSEWVPEHLPIIFFSQYYKKPASPLQVANKLKLVDFLIKCKQSSVRYDDLLNAKMEAEKESQQAEQEKELDLFRLALEALYRPSKTNIQNKKINEVLVKTVRVIRESKYERSQFLCIANMNMLPPLKIILHSNKKILQEDPQLCMTVVAYLFNFLSHEFPNNEVYLKLLQDFLARIKLHYERLVSVFNVNDFQEKLRNLFEECILIMTDFYKEERDICLGCQALGSILSLLEKIQDKNCKSIIHLLNLIDHRAGYYDPILQNMIGHLIKNKKGWRQDDFREILDHIFQITVLRRRTLYFPILLDFAQSNRDLPFIQNQFARKKVQMNIRADELEFDHITILRYYSYINLLEMTSQGVNEERLKRMSDSLEQLIEGLKLTKQRFRQIFQIINRTVSLLYEKTANHQIYLQKVIPFIQFWCSLLFQVRNSYEAIITLNDRQKCQIIVKVSQQIKKIVLPFLKLKSPLDRKRGNQIDHLMEQVEELSKAGWIRVRDCADIYKGNCLVIMFILANFQRGKTVGYLMPEIIKYAHAIPDKEWKLMVALSFKKKQQRR